MKMLITTDAVWLERWDEFILNDNRGSHLLLSDWLKSFSSYGFEYEVCLAVENDKILGGFGAVVAKALFFKFYIVPFGPIATKGSGEILKTLIDKVHDRASEFDACYAHITLPVSTAVNPHIYDGQIVGLPAENGHLFKYVYSSNGLNWVDISQYQSEDAILENLKTYTRRNVRASLRKGLEMRLLETDDDVRAGYDLCLLTASQNGYALRDYASFEPTLRNLIGKGFAKFIGAYKEDVLKGCILLVRGGNYFTYILGGTIKEKPDLLTGHFLQWHAIKLSFENGFDGYNISLGGSPGILDFKAGYATEQILFENSKFHWLLKPGYFSIYLFFDRHLKRHKKSISRLLSLLRKR